MHYDETEFRILDAKLMTALLKRGAKPSDVKAFHALPARISAKQQPQLNAAGMKDKRQTFLHLRRIVVSLEKEYKSLCAKARWDLDQDIAAKLDGMKGVLDAFHKEERHVVTPRDAQQHYRGVRLMVPGMDLDRHKTQVLGAHYAAMSYGCKLENDKEFPLVFDGRPGKRVVLCARHYGAGSCQSGSNEPPSGREDGVLRVLSLIHI